MADQVEDLHAPKTAVALIAGISMAVTPIAGTVAVEVGANVAGTTVPVWPKRSGAASRESAEQKDQKAEKCDSASRQPRALLWTISDARLPSPWSACGRLPKLLLRNVMCAISI
jgi:hypothetical protein